MLKGQDFSNNILVGGMLQAPIFTCAIERMFNSSRNYHAEKDLDFRMPQCEWCILKLRVYLIRNMLKRQGILLLVKMTPTMVLQYINPYLWFLIHVILEGIINGQSSMRVER